MSCCWIFWYFHKTVMGLTNCVDLNMSIVRYSRVRIRHCLLQVPTVRTTGLEFFAGLRTFFQEESIVLYYIIRSAVDLHPIGQPPECKWSIRVDAFGCYCKNEIKTIPKSWRSLPVDFSVTWNHPRRLPSPLGSGTRTWTRCLAGFRDGYIARDGRTRRHAHVFNLQCESTVRGRRSVRPVEIFSRSLRQSAVSSTIRHARTDNI